VERRSWVPDVKMLADQLIADYRDGGEIQGANDAMETFVSWRETARLDGGEFTEDDWVTLAQELARRCAGID
jgi:hypothetical protein